MKSCQKEFCLVSDSPFNLGFIIIVFIVVVHEWDSQVALGIKNFLPMQEAQETRVWSVGQADPLEEGTAIHSSILAGRIPWTEESGGLQSVWLQRAGHDWAQHSTVGILFTESVCRRALVWHLKQHMDGVLLKTVWQAVQPPGTALPVVPGCNSHWRHRTRVSKPQPQTKLGLLLIFVNKLVLEQSHGPLVTHHLWQLLLYPGRIESFWHIPWGHKAFYSLALCSKLASFDTEEAGEHLLFSPSSTQVSLSWQQLLTPLWGAHLLHSASMFTEGPVLLQLQEGAPGLTSAAKVRVISLRMGVHVLGVNSGPLIRVFFLFRREGFFSS